MRTAGCRKMGSHYGPESSAKTKGPNAGGRAQIILLHEREERVKCEQTGRSAFSLGSLILHRKHDNKARTVINTRPNPVHHQYRPRQMREHTAMHNLKRSHCARTRICSFAYG